MLSVTCPGQECCCYERRECDSALSQRVPLVLSAVVDQFGAAGYLAGMQPATHDSQLTYDTKGLFTACCVVLKVLCLLKVITFQHQTDNKNNKTNKIQSQQHTKLTTYKANNIQSQQNNTIVTPGVVLLQEASVWLPKNTKDLQQHQELMTVRLALVRSVAQAHLTASQPPAATQS